MSRERQRQVKGLRVATTPFALCVKRSEGRWREGQEIGEGEDRREKGEGGHGQRRFHNVSKLNRTQGVEGEGKG